MCDQCEAFKSERDAALKARDEAEDQVGMLREALIGLLGPDWECPHGVLWSIPCEESPCGLDPVRQALSNTSATAQQFVEKVRREALEKQDQTGWLVERNMAAEGQEYLFVDPVGLLAWTTDNLKALRLSRKSDAESLVAIAEDAVRVAEHAWIRRAAILGEKAPE